MEDKFIIGVFFYVMEKVGGIIIDNKVVKDRKILVFEFLVIVNSWLDILVELYDLDYELLGLGDLGKFKGYVER